MRLIESISDYTRTDRLAILWSGDVAIGHDLSGDIGGGGWRGEKIILIQQRQFDCAGHHCLLWDAE